MYFFFSQGLGDIDFLSFKPFDLLIVLVFSYYMKPASEESSGSSCDPVKSFLVKRE